MIILLSVLHREQRGLSSYHSHHEKYCSILLLEIYRQFLSGFSDSEKTSKTIERKKNPRCGVLFWEVFSITWVCSKLVMLLYRDENKMQIFFFCNFHEVVYNTGKITSSLWQTTNLLLLIHRLPSEQILEQDEHLFLHLHLLGPRLPMTKYFNDFWFIHWQHLMRNTSWNFSSILSPSLPLRRSVS